MDGRHRTQMCGRSHVTAPPVSNTYLGVVKKESVQLAGWIKGSNNMLMWMGVVTNAFPWAPVCKQVYFIASPEFEELEGYIVLITMALYGLKTSGAAFHAYLVKILLSLGYQNCLADPDAWYQNAIDDHGNKYYEYLMVHVNNILAISHNPKLLFDELQQKFDMKGVGEPQRYLGANIGKCAYGSETFRYLSLEQYLEDKINTLETHLGRSLTTKHIATPRLHPSILNWIKVPCSHPRNIHIIKA